MLGADAGRLVFVSGATEGIQTAVLSALSALRHAVHRPALLLYGATEHKAVPQALQHWNALLGLGLQLLPIPVGRDGRHDLAWLREHAPQAGLVCTMAANNETGVVSDLDGIAAVLADSPALWLVDGVQALGKLPLRLAERGVDYAPFSGHKLYAPKGIGLLYVRDGAPFTPLMAGGGQEGALRAGTENMPGIAALGAVLAALEEGRTSRDAATLATFRERLADALQQAFPELVFNAPAALCLPTTLSFAVPGVSARLLLDLFDAAELRVSGGSACGAARAQPSEVLAAMGLPAWQVASSVRLSFGPLADAAFIDEACARIRACGDALRDAAPQVASTPAPEDAADMACSAAAPAPVELGHEALRALAAAHRGLVLLDVREPHEQRLGRAPDLGVAVRREAVALSSLPNALPRWLASSRDMPIVCFCRSGKRSALAAQALRRLGHHQVWSLAGGLALWPQAVADDAALAI
ncbi:MAG: aminotransferase class V-fold PLP-dependent enzyme [Roseateles sp.]